LLSIHPDEVLKAKIPEIIPHSQSESKRVELKLNQRLIAMGTAAEFIGGEAMGR
jgi:hypothetical protein